jgi:hypothetical protein
MARGWRRAGSAPVAAGLRAGLALLTLIEAVQGAWQYFAPRSFFLDVPTVAADPPFNEHLMSDIGGLGLAMAVLLGASAWFAERTLVRVALTAFIVYSVSHLLFHATHPAGLTAAGAVLLFTGLALLPGLGLGLLILTFRADPAVSRPGSPGQGSAPAGRGRLGRPW